MATRQKIYYADDEIQTNLYTSGLILMVLDTWENYIGPYHYYTSTSEVFTESEWHPTKSKKLVPYRSNRPPSYFKYVDLVNYKNIGGEKKELIGPVRLDKFSSPMNYLIQPSEKEKLDGSMIRYFVFKRNEKAVKIPYEIDKQQVESYRHSTFGINQYLYELAEVPWKLTGPEYDILENGLVKIPGVYNTNKRIVEKYSKKFPILLKTLTNYRQFSIYDV